MSEVEKNLETAKKALKAAEWYFETDNIWSAYKSIEVWLEICFSKIIDKNHKCNQSKGKEDKKTVAVIHYTNLDTVVSMLKKQGAYNQRSGGSAEGSVILYLKKQSAYNQQQASLRLYDSIHSNDPGEGKYLALKLPEKLPKEHKWLRDWLLEEEDPSHAYIASFISPINDSGNHNKLKDNLTFWRAYGRDGAGCSLSIRVPRQQLRKVLYGEDGIKKLMKHLLPILNHHLLKLLVESHNDQIKMSIRKKLSEQIEKIRYLYKSEAYAYEHECRIVIPESEVDENNSEIQFEYKKQNDTSPIIRHYIEIDDLKINKLLITGSTITLGPTVPHPENVRYCLKNLLEKSGLTGCEVKTSKIPYRRP